MKRLCLAAALALLPAPALALTDEIQVYTGDVAAPGVFNLTWHNNYTPDGLKMPDFPAGLTDNHSWSGVTEWAYGVTPWFEAGLYLPLYADSSFDAFKRLQTEAVAAGLPSSLLLDKKGCEIGVLQGPAAWDSADGKAVIDALKAL